MHFPCTGGQLRAKPPVFASTLREQLFDLKIEDAITKSENLGDLFKVSLLGIFDIANFQCEPI
jgi:hypothetical protein